MTNKFSRSRNRERREFRIEIVDKKFKKVLKKNLLLSTTIIERLKKINDNESLNYYSNKLCRDFNKKDEMKSSLFFDKIFNFLR